MATVDVGPATNEASRSVRANETARFQGEPERESIGCHGNAAKHGPETGTDRPFLLKEPKTNKQKSRFDRWTSSSHLMSSTSMTLSATPVESFPKWRHFGFLFTFGACGNRVFFKPSFSTRCVEEHSLISLIS